MRDGSFNNPGQDDKRERRVIHLRPSLRRAIDADRAGTDLTRSAWIERAILAKLEDGRESRE